MRSIPKFVAAVVATSMLVLVALPVLAQEDTPEAALAQAMEIYNKRTDLRSFGAAVKKLKAVADKYPSYYDAQWKLSRAYYYLSQRYEKRKDDIPTAAKLSKIGSAYGKKALKIKPKGYDGLYWQLANEVRVVAAESKIRAFSMAGEVMATLHGMIKAEPNRFEAYMVLGGMYRVLPGPPLGKGDMKKALELVKKAEELAPTDPEVLLELAETYLAMDDTTTAKLYYEKAAKAPSPPEKDFETEDAHEYAVDQLKKLEKK